MGTHSLLLLPLSFAKPPLPPLHPLLSNTNKSCCTRSFNGGGSYWDRKKSGPTSTGGLGFSLEDEVYNTDDDDGFDEFAFGAAKKRVWWSNEEEDVDDDWGFGEEENWFGPIFRVLRTFGWMLPAIAVTFLLGTGPNAFFMALAVPLGQTALSLVFDKVWGNTVRGPKPRNRAKNRKKPFNRATSGTKTSSRKEENKTSNGIGGYQSWATDANSRKKSNKRVPRYGGWDDLDQASYEASRGTRKQNQNGLPRQQNKDKLSKIGRARETPLLIRLLIAAFPFLSSWTKFLF